MINILSPITQHIPVVETISLIPRQYSYVFPSIDEFQAHDPLPTPFISDSPFLPSQGPVVFSKSSPQSDEFSFVPFVHFKDVDLELEGGDSTNVDTFAPVNNEFETVDRMDTGIDGIQFDEVRLGNDNIPVFNIYPSYDIPAVTTAQMNHLQTPTPSLSSLTLSSFKIQSPSILPHITPEQLSYVELNNQHLFDSTIKIKVSLLLILKFSI